MKINDQVLSEKSVIQPTKCIIHVFFHKTCIHFVFPVVFVCNTPKSVVCSTPNTHAGAQTLVPYWFPLCCSQRYRSAGKKQNFPRTPSQKGLKSFRIPLTSKHDMLNTLGKGMFLKLFMKIGLRMRWLHENLANTYHLQRFESNPSKCVLEDCSFSIGNSWTKSNAGGIK